MQQKGLPKPFHANPVISLAFYYKSNELKKPISSYFEQINDS